jgi:hypothetical protein
MPKSSTTCPKCMKKPQKTWKIIDDVNICHIWATPDGKQEISVSPSWYQSNGTPCDDDGEDMIYVRTEIFV